MDMMSLLSVTVKRASLVGDAVAQNSTYVTLKLENVKSTTVAVKGANPAWEQDFLFETSRMDTGLIIEVWNKGLIWDKVIGYHYLPLYYIQFSNEETEGQWLSLDAELVMEGNEVVGTKNPTGHHILVDCRFELPFDLGDNEALQQKLEMLNAMVEQENGKDASRRMMFSAHCFHEIFQVLKDECCRLKTLNVTHCSLTKADVICLGEVLHRNSSLDSLRVQGLSKIDHIFPLVIGLQENTSLQLLDISSSHVTMTDFPFQCFVQILTRIRSLKSLNISGWTVKLEEARSLHCLGSFLKTCTIRDLNLAGCKIFVSVEDPEKGKYDSLLETLSKGLQPYPECEVAFLNLSGCQVIMMTSRGQVSLQASDLIPFLSPLAKLTSLNASLKRGNDPVCKIGEKTIINFFQSLGSKLSNLRRLTISNWSAQIENSEKASKVIAKSLKQLDLKALTVNRLQVVDGLGQKSLSHIFLSTLLLGLPQLTYFSIKGTVMSVEEAAVVARCIAERHKGPFLDLSVRHFPPEVLKEFRAVLIASGKVFPSVIRCAACHNEELRIELRPAQNTGVWDAFACSLK